MKFLIDECLSPELARLARDVGHADSTHVTWMGLASRPDWAITRRAVDDGFLLVTHNSVDFRALYGREELHTGLVCLNAAPGLVRLDLQRRLFRLALVELGGAEFYNEVLEISAGKDGTVQVSRYDLPPSK